MLDVQQGVAGRKGVVMPSAGCRCFVATWSVVGTALVVSGCTTFRPVVGTAEETQRRLLGGEVLAAGDRVRLTTADGQVHEMRVDSVALDGGTILGDGDAVPIRNVVSVEQRVRAPAKTWGLVGGLALLLLGSDCEDDPSCDLGYGGFCC
jgi:hypothetical protein